MITHAEIEKLLGVRAAVPTVLSLYLRVPHDPPALRSLSARADDLLAQAGRGAADDPDAIKAQDADRRIARRMLEVHAREWLDRTVAIFACGEPRLAETVVLPCAVQDRAVFAARPHVRPMLLAVQRFPGYHLAIIDRQHAWVFRIAGEQMDRMTLPAAEGARTPEFGGWYGLETHRENERVLQLARHHYRDAASVLRRVMHAAGPELLVLGGHRDAIPQFLAMLPDDVRYHLAGSFIADPHTTTPARVRDLADQVIERWVTARERRVVTQVLQEPPGGHLTAIGLHACLAAVNQRAVRLLVVPEGGIAAGFTCQRCGRLSRTGTDCPDWGAASLAVPDLIEDMVVTALDDGAQVETVRDPPGGVAARLRFTLAPAEERSVRRRSPKSGAQRAAAASSGEQKRPSGSQKRPSGSQKGSPGSHTR